MKYAIIGTGAIGGFYGGMLAKAGKDVHFLFHSDYKEVCQNGLLIDSEVFGQIRLPHVQAYQNTQEMPVCDVIFICLKTVNNKTLLPQLLPPLLSPNSIIVLIQNGLGMEEDVSKLFPKIQIAGGLAFVGSNKIGPGHIHHLEHGDLNLGSYNVQNMAQLEQVAQDLQTAGIKSFATADLPKLRWQKLIWNITFNGMTVVLNTSTDKIMRNKALRQLSLEIMLEVIAGARACGVALSDQLAPQMIEYTSKMLPYLPSMKLDYDHHRPLEIQYIYQNPVAAALSAGYKMTRVDMLTKQLEFITAQEG